MADEPGDEEVTPTPQPGTTGTTRAAARKAAAEAGKGGGAPEAKASPAAKSLAKPQAAKPAATARTGGGTSVPKRQRKPDAATVKAAARSGNPAKKAAAVAETSRYTPPVPNTQKVSPWYVPVFMFGFLGLGMLIIFFNYIEWPLGDASNWRLLAGLGSILAGILVATRYH